MSTDVRWTDQHNKLSSSPSPIEDLVAVERARLLEEAGLRVPPPPHFRRPVERSFTRQERDHVTLLIGGLTRRHDWLIQAALEGLGYKVDLVPLPTKADCQSGKEYANNGQCNPTYFTIGALVNHLKRLRDKQSIPTEQILANYIFATGGSCGPCRFGMYEAEYRLALRNAGFDGFRVIVFDQEGGVSQSGSQAGLEMSLPFFLVFLNAIVIGDLLNAIAFHIRPYEARPGAGERVLDKCLAVCQEALKAKSHTPVQSGLWSKLLSWLTGYDAAPFLDQLSSTHYIEALERCRRIIDEEMEVDYARPKAVVKITGEFWAQTTEGDGNFGMFPLLEKEGAEVLVEPVTTYLDYVISQGRLRSRDRRGLINDEKARGLRRFLEHIRCETAYRKWDLVLVLAAKILAREYERMRKALGATVHPLANQLELQRIGHPYYNARCEGGEGHLEVAKNIYYINRDLAHMVLSLKPFGCMPSTQSDGAQAAVVANYPDMIYLPIETSGEGDINAHSRVQMALGEAKAKCRDEFKSVIERTGYGLEDIRAYVAEHRGLRRPLQSVPHARGVVGRAANFVLHVATLMDRDLVWAARKREAVATTVSSG